MSTPEALLLLGAVVAGLVVQAVLSLRQQRRFARDVAALQREGTVAVGVGGKRYRGGRVYVVLCADPGGMVRRALQLRGFSTFTTARPFGLVVGRRVTELVGTRPVDGLDRSQREAVKQAAEALRAARKGRAAKDPGGAAGAAPTRTAPSPEPKEEHTT